MVMVVVVVVVVMADLNLAFSRQVWRQTRANTGSGPPTAAGFSHALAQMGGWSGLMRGTVPACAARFLISGSSFSLLSDFRNQLSATFPAWFPAAATPAGAVVPAAGLLARQSPLLTTFAAGTLAGVILSYVSGPLVNATFHSQLLVVPSQFNR